MISAIMGYFMNLSANLADSASIKQSDLGRQCLSKVFVSNENMVQSALDIP